MMALQTRPPSDQTSIRDEMRGTIESGIVLSRWDDEQIMFAAKVTDLILASPVIRRIQADTLRSMAARVRREWFPHTCPWVGYLDDEATRIEKEMGDD